jgi:hypothetical protein
MPSLPDGCYDKKNAFCVRVDTDALHPHLRRDSYLYVSGAPLSAIRDDTLVIYEEQGESESIKETEWQADGKLLLKGIGRGKTLSIEVDELSAVRKVVFIGM